MLEFSGERDFGRPVAEVFAKLGDVNFLSRCIPGAEGVSCPAPDTITGTLRPGFSFMRGTMNLTVRILEATPESTIRYQLAGKGIGSSNTVEVTLNLAPSARGTHAHYQAKVTEMGGLLKAIPQGLVKASAQKVIGDVWNEVDARLGS
ncbi:MAG: SRPBCC domain-containing protein [Gemmataceae bacterium]